MYLLQDHGLLNCWVYALPVWDPNIITNINKPETIQRAAAIFCLNDSWDNVL